MVVRMSGYEGMKVRGKRRRFVGGDGMAAVGAGSVDKIRLCI